MWRFAFSTKSLRYLSLHDSLNEISEAGFKAVELYAERPHAYPSDFNAKKASQFITQLNELKLRVVNIDAYCTYGAAQLNRYLSWLSEDWLEREEQIKYTLDCVRVAAALGVKTVTISGGSPIPETMDRLEAWRLFVANMFRVLSVAERLGINLLLRPSPGFLIETADHIVSFLKEMEFPENLKVDFDIAHIICAGENPCEAFDKVASFVENVHLSDVLCRDIHSHLMVGEGELNIQEFFDCLSEHDYSGYVVINVDTEESSAKQTLINTVEKLKEHGVWNEERQ